MHANEQTISKFYTAFAALDADTMATCYADGATFEDPVFRLQGKSEVMGMWRMLGEAARAQQSADAGGGHGNGKWQLDFSDVRADETRGTAHWEAHYNFSATGRRVHNVIDAAFTFDDAGLIATHRDTFGFWAWSRQALGLPGLLLGWTPMLHNKVRATAAGNLRRYLAKSKG